MLGTDYVGLGALISAIGAALVSVIVALRQSGTKSQVADIHDAVHMANGQTLGQVVEESQARDVAIDKAKEANP